MTHNDEIELRSEEVQEILGTPPSWLIRWGTLVWFLTIGALITATWFVQYPDMLQVRVQINSATPPVEVIARAEGNIAEFFVTDNQEVKQGQILGIVQSTANYADITRLDSVITQIQGTQAVAMEGLQLPTGLVLGELQGAYASFSQNLDVHKFGKTDKTFNDADRIAGLRNQKANLRKRIQVNESIRQKAKQELDLEQKSFDRQKTLYNEGLISLNELQTHNRRLVEIQRNYKSLENNDIEIQSEINNLDDAISGVQFNTKENTSNTALQLSESLSALTAGIEKWKQIYLLSAPINGRVSLNANIFSAQQYVRTGDQVLTIAPPQGSEINGRLDLPIAGSGKVKPGQRVIIYLDNYPYEEFGTVEGTVVSKSAIPKENVYTIQIAFEKGLKTSLNTEIPFEQALQGRGEIITDNRRLLTRFLDKVFSYKRN
jgi:multidrug resistance efflux pump